MTEDSSRAESETDQRGMLDEFRILVRAAFDQARASGKPDWREMTSAVLKNRLLNLTDRQFSEDRYGSPSFVHLVRRIPDVVEVLEDQPPFLLRIRVPDIIITAGDVGVATETINVIVEGPVATHAPERDWRRVRVRDDLWHAIMDNNSGDVYVLDRGTGRARPKKSSDEDLPVLPTTSRDDVASWRHQFVESISPSIKTKFNDELDTWRNREGRQVDLPRSIRGKWVEFLKRKVSDRLNEWFISEGERPPDDILVVTESSAPPQAEAIDEVVRARQLQDLIIRAVRTMTYDELTKITLPSFALLRISGRAPKRQGTDD